MRRAAILLLFLAAGAAAKPDAEAKLKAKLARVWVDYARWCKLQGLKTEATDALSRAREADASAPDLAKLAAEVEALEGDGEADAARRKKAWLEAAKVYEKLGKLDERYLVEAARLDPSKARLKKLAGLVKKLAGNRKEATAAGLLLVQLRDLDPDGKYDALEIELAKKDVALVKHKDHPLVGFLSLPKGWKAGGSYPVLVAVDGAGSGFLNAARKFGSTRAGRDFLVLAPCTLANTNELKPDKYPYYPPALLEEHNRDRISFDLEGLEKLLAVLAERYGAQPKIGITGFSGGGNLCYAWTALHPDRTLFSVPACANFGGLGFREATPVEDGGPPVRVLTGEKDPHRDFTFGRKDSPGIEPQTDNAMAALERLGFKNVRRTMLKGVAHSACHGEVWKVCDEVKG